MPRTTSVPTRRVRRLVLTLLAASVVAAACGSDDPETLGDAGPVPEVEVAAASADSTLPEVVVRDVGAESWVQLKNLLPADRPLLVWFWAPH